MSTLISHWIAIVSTLTSFVCFVGIVYFAFAPRFRARWEQHAQIPFEATEPESALRPQSVTK